LCAFPVVYVLPDGLTATELNEMTQGLQLSGHYYPNLMFHSDCEGAYTKTGKVLEPGKEWTTGNLHGLLSELKLLEKEAPEDLKTGRPWGTFKMLYALVEDEVRLGGNKIEFH